MIPFCAKQGVDRKISFDDFLSAMLSDYECAYACGLAARKLKIKEASEQMPLADLKALVEKSMPRETEGLDFHVRNLYQLIKEYTPDGADEVPEEIPVLIRMGLDSENLDEY